MYGNYLAHHGIKGQKWGVRRYQNEDGSLTAEGKRHSRKVNSLMNKAHARAERNSEQRYVDSWNEVADELNSSDYFKTHDSDDPKVAEDIMNEVAKRYNRKLVSDIQKDKYYKKAEAIASEHMLAEWDDNYKAYKREENNIQRTGWDEDD